ncbi:MAG: transposase, partial [Lachnospiraceae bacterium]|nr:transposase [Lachnospiraceae bacterium]
NPLFMVNRNTMYSLLHKSVGQSIVELCQDPKYLGAVPGIIQVLHTWNQRLLFHPHIHAVVSGGGLTEDRKLKVLEKNSFFIAESVLSAMFRGKFLDGLEKLYHSGKLIIPAALGSLENPADWSSFRDRLYTRKWVAHVKETFNGNGNAIEYLGRYTNKIAITDSRIVSVSGEAVTFTVRGADGKQSETVTITPVEFIMRYLLHVLPKGFQKIRYYGYLNNSRRRDNMLLIFNLQGFRQFLQKCKGMDSAAVIMAKWGYDICACPHCSSHKMITLFRTRSQCASG